MDVSSFVKNVYSETCLSWKRSMKNYAMLNIICNDNAKMLDNPKFYISRSFEYIESTLFQK